jgi:hypothetical protein
MSFDLKSISLKNVAWDISKAALSGLVVYHLYLKTCSPSSKYMKTVKKPDSVLWIDECQYNVFSAICDTLIPALTSSECSSEKLQESLNAIHKEVTKETGMTLQHLLNNKRYLCAGACDYGTNRHAAETLQLFISNEELAKLSTILKLFNTSVGTFLLTGYPVPFQVCHLISTYSFPHYVYLQNAFSLHITVSLFCLFSCDLLHLHRNCHYGHVKKY